MKNPQKIKRVQLKLNPIDEFIILGIVSTEPDYKLSLSINRKFSISLRNATPVKARDIPGEELIFSRFTDNRMAPGVVFNLVSNRIEKKFLLKNLKNVDYIFQVYDPENEHDQDDIANKLREIDSINAVFKIDLNTFKDKNLHFLIQ
jgi:hypothetical protein